MWPDGARCAAAFTFDFDAEEVWIGENPANANSPGVLSQGTYGAKVAVPLILDMLARHGVQATFYIPGRVAERHPKRVERDRRRRARDRPSRLHPHLAQQADPRRGGGRARPRPGDPARVRRGGDRLPLAVVGSQPAHPGPAASARFRVLLESHGRHQAVPARDRAAGRGAHLLDTRRRAALLVRRLRAGPRPSRQPLMCGRCGRRNSSASGNWAGPACSPCIRRSSGGRPGSRSSITSCRSSPACPTSG